MKNYIAILFCLMSVLFTSSCGSDDSKDKKISENPIDPNQPVTVKSEWEPSTIKLVKVIPLQTIAYPHTTGCTKDYLQLMTDNSAKFYHYEGADCKITSYDNAFQRNGNNVTVNILGYSVKGDIQKETDTYMEIHSDISEYIPLIKAQFPEYEQYLGMLDGGTVQLALNKK